MEYSIQEDRPLISEKDPPQPKGLSVFSFGNCSKNFRNLLIAIFNIITNVIMNVSLPIFSGTMGSKDVGGDNFVLLILTSFSVSVLFAVLTLFIRYTRIDPKASLKPSASWKVLVAMGLFTTLNGILVVYASLPERTPPYLQGILSATVIPFTVICRLIILRKGISIVRGICTCMVLVGVFITTEPQMWNLGAVNPSESSSATLARILWPLCFAAGFLPIGLSNVFCEKELKKDEGDSLSFIFWTNLFQFISMVFFFWTDFIPGFGKSSSAKQFFHKFSRGLHCLFSTEAQCHNLIGKAWLFFFGYCAGNLFQFLLIQYAEGAIFAVIVQAMITPICAIFWTFFSYNDETDVFKWSPTYNITTSFTIAGLVVIVPGVILYNYFSRQEIAEANAKVDDTVDVKVL